MTSNDENDSVNRLKEPHVLGEGITEARVEEASNDDQLPPVSSSSSSSPGEETLQAAAPPPPQRQHIRPTVRRRKNPPPAAAATSATTRSSVQDAGNPTPPAAAVAPEVQQDTTTPTKPPVAKEGSNAFSIKSILRTPKYTKKENPEDEEASSSLHSQANEPSTAQHDKSVTLQVSKNPRTEATTTTTSRHFPTETDNSTFNDAETETDPMGLFPAPPRADSGVVVERNVSSRRRKNRNRGGAGSKSSTGSSSQAPSGGEKSSATPTTSTNATTMALAVEGHVPTTTHLPSTMKETAEQPPRTSKIQWSEEPPSQKQQRGDEKQQQSANPPPTNNTGTKDSPSAFGSLAELMQAAGTLPTPKEAAKALSQEGTVVEASLEFNVLSPQQFEELMVEEQQEINNEPTTNNDNPEDEDGPPVTDEDEDVDNPLDNPEEEDWFSDENDENGDTSNTDNPRNRTSVGGSFWELFDDDDDEEEEPVSTRGDVRAFTVLWKAISQWVTPEAASWVCQLLASYEQQQSQGGNAAALEAHAKLISTTYINTQWSDIEESRCAGLMTLIQLHLRYCIEEDLQRPLQERRQIEQMLLSLLRRFDFSQSSPVLNSSQSKALTTILILIVIPSFATEVDSGESEEKGGKVLDSLQIPKSCLALGMTIDEFRYLTRSAIPNFRND